MGEETRQAYLDDKLREFRSYMDERLDAFRAANSAELQPTYSAKLRDLETTVEGYRSRAVSAYENEMADIEHARGQKPDEHQARLLALKMPKIQLTAS